MESESLIIVLVSLLVVLGVSQAFIQSVLGYKGAEGVDIDP